MSQQDDWQPTASPETLRLRADLYARTRQFFAEREVLEVETPALCEYAVSDTHVHSLTVNARLLGGGDRYLHTSPEYAMKRLLAAGYGDIYQICKVYRDGEAGTWHNPEFTLLEWYRVGFDHRALMGELADLLQCLLFPDGERPVVTMSYRDAVRLHAGVDPQTAGKQELDDCLRRWEITLPNERSFDDCLDLLVSAVVGPRLGAAEISLIYDYPPTQAGLARIGPGSPPAAERFEAYIDGVELANGYHELTDAAEQRSRFHGDMERRTELGLPQPPLDRRFLAALDAGLAPCAGVALGFDRVVMLASGAEHIEEVLSFPTSRA